MPDIIIKKCCSVLPEGKTRDGKLFLRCPVCGNETYMFPTGVLQKTSSPSERYVTPGIAAEAAKRWNESILTKEEVNGR